MGEAVCRGEGVGRGFTPPCYRPQLKWRGEPRPAIYYKNGSNDLTVAITKFTMSASTLIAGFSSEISGALNKTEILNLCSGTPTLIPSVSSTSPTLIGRALSAGRRNKSGKFSIEIFRDLAKSAKCSRTETPLTVEFVLIRRWCLSVLLSLLSCQRPWPSPPF